ncbi:MAG: helix-hairpin-helix domain-containing protein, partial [Planctomycetes bacterium]|nr:helix-hairpin-helix domain-containing protein [Planctomycetota bacterium]
MIVDHPDNINKCAIRDASQRTGLVLVFVLWVLVILAVMVVALALDTRLDSAVRLAAADRVTARWLARAGVARAISEILADNNQNDGPNDSWYDNEDIFDRAPLPGGSFTVFADRFLEDNQSAYGVIDEASKLNLNTATREMLMALPEMPATVADQIIEFRQHRSDLLDNLDQLIPNESLTAVSSSSSGFLTIRELGLLKEMTDELLNGEDTNFNGILENQENDGAYLPPLDNQDRQLDRGLLCYVTVYSR